MVFSLCLGAFVRQNRAKACFSHDTKSQRVEEQGVAAQEIARNVHQAAQGTAHVAANIMDVSRGAGDTEAASTQVLSSAESLSHESNNLKIAVEKFLTMVRAA